MNDNPPVLSGSFFDHTITENYGATLTQSDQVLITGINVTDADTVSTSFQYSVVDPLKTLGLFNVDPNTVSHHVSLLLYCLCCRVTYMYHLVHTLIEKTLIMSLMLLVELSLHLKYKSLMEHTMTKLKYDLQ